MKNSSIPLWPLGVLALFAVGCSFHAFGGSDSPPKIKPIRFQVDPGPLEAPAQWAAQLWSYATGRTITATADGDVPIFAVDATGCPAPSGTVNMACSLDMGTPDARIQVWQDANPAYLPVVLLHEMGHHLRGDNSHLKAPSNAVMLPIPDWKPLSTSSHPLTAEDVRFICENFDCAAINV